jgi:hypothetical protein
MPRLSAEYYVERTHPRCVDVLAIRKIPSTEDDRLETDVLPMSAATEEIHYHEVLRGRSVETVPIFVQYRLSFYTAEILVSPWLMSVQSVGDLQ